MDTEAPISNTYKLNDLEEVSLALHASVLFLTFLFFYCLFLSFFFMLHSLYLQSGVDMVPKS